MKSSTLNDFVTILKIIMDLNPTVSITGPSHHFTIIDIHTCKNLKFQDP